MFRTRQRPALVSLAALTLLGACAGPTVRTGGDADPSTARGLLVAASATGEPVPLAVDTVPRDAYPMGVDGIASTANAAVARLGARFAPTELQAVDPERRRVVLRFEDAVRNPALACSAQPPRGVVPATGPTELYAVFCDGARPVADVSGTAAAEGPTAADELVQLSMNRLFPGESSGYSAFPGVSLGVGVGSGGGWGLGGGLSF